MNRHVFISIDNDATRQAAWRALADAGYQPVAVGRQDIRSTDVVVSDSDDTPGRTVAIRPRGVIVSATDIVIPGDEQRLVETVNRVMQRPATKHVVVSCAMAPALSAQVSLTLALLWQDRVTWVQDGDHCLDLHTVLKMRGYIAGEDGCEVGLAQLIPKSRCRGAPIDNGGVVIHDSAVGDDRAPVADLYVAVHPATMDLGDHDTLAPVVVATYGPRRLFRRAHITGDEVIHIADQTRADVGYDRMLHRERYFRARMKQVVATCHGLLEGDAVATP